MLHAHVVNGRQHNRAHILIPHVTTEARTGTASQTVGTTTVEPMTE